MTLPTAAEAKKLLHSHVGDPYQRHHAEMVAASMAEYARLYGEDEVVWWVTGYLHDIDFEQHPNEHPGPSLQWFRDWGYPEALIHAVEAHANGFNGFTTAPETVLARALIACDEISGIFYAYQKLNPIPYSDMKVSSIKKRLKEERFAPGIDRCHIYAAVAALDITIDEHITNLLNAFAALPHAIAD